MGRLLASASMVVALAGVAHAQTAPTAPNPQPAQSDAQAQSTDTTTSDKDIVVNGYRKSIEASLSQKRVANAFIDVITAEDVGKFPTRTSRIHCSACRASSSSAAAAKAAASASVACSRT
jgi:hypothetical protein